MEYSVLFFEGLSPRILHEEATSRVIIQESDNAHGVLRFKQPEIVVSEQSVDGSNIVVVMISVQRTGNIPLILIIIIIYNYLY